MLLAGCATSPNPSLRDWGPLYSHHEDLDGNARTRALGPLVEHATSPAGDEFLAVRPFYSRTADAVKEKVNQEALWPLASSRHWLNEHRWWIGPAMGWDYAVDDPDSQRRFWIVPFWFSGRTRGGEDYWALFPVYGKLREFLGRDEADFVLFPVHLRTRVNDIESTAWAWPVYSRTKGDGVERFRVFPFYGWSQWRDRVRQKFILWPFWNQVEYTYEDHPGHAWMLWPIYGRLRTEAKQIDFYLPPFFRVENEKGGRKLHLPWPIYQRQTGEDLDKLYVFPLFGRKRIGSTRTDFLLWPVFSHQTIARGGGEIERWLAMPVLQHETRTDAAGAVTTRKEKVWPLGSYRREGDVARTRLLDLWPLMDTPAVERNYAPLWSLYRGLRKGGARDRELLWGLYRDLERGEGERFRGVFPIWDDWAEDGRAGWNVLKGLVGVERDADGGQALRLLWFLRLGGDDSGDDAGNGGDAP